MGYTRAVDDYGALLAEYRERARSALFMASNQAAVTFGVGLSGTVATFALHNPAGSGKYLLVRKAFFAFSTAPAAAAIVWLCAGLDATPPATNTPITVRNGILGSATAGVGIAYSATTLGAAPVIIRPIGSVVAASSITPAPVHADIDGEIIVAPATQLVFQASAACVGYCGVAWEELATW